MSKRFSDMFSVLFQGPLDRDLDLIFALLGTCKHQSIEMVNLVFLVNTHFVSIAEHKLIGPHQGEFRISSVIDRGELQF